MKLTKRYQATVDIEIEITKEQEGKILAWLKENKSKEEYDHYDYEEAYKAVIDSTEFYDPSAKKEITGEADYVDYWIEGGK